MSGVEWRPYSVGDADIIENAVKIFENSDRTVLFARSKFKDQNEAEWLFGDYTVGEGIAKVWNVNTVVFQREDFEVSI